MGTQITANKNAQGGVKVERRESHSGDLEGLNRGGLEFRGNLDVQMETMRPCDTDESHIDKRLRWIQGARGLRVSRREDRPEGVEG